MTKPTDSSVSQINKSLFDKVDKKSSAIGESAILKIYDRLDKIDSNKGLVYVNAELLQIHEEGTKAEKL